MAFYVVVVKKFLMMLLMKTYTNIVMDERILGEIHGNHSNEVW